MQHLDDEYTYTLLKLNAVPEQESWQQRYQSCTIENLDINSIFISHLHECTCVSWEYLQTNEL